MIMFDEEKQISEVLSRVMKFVGRNPTIIEAGAHNGHDTVRLADYFDNPRIFAFEPMPKQFSRLLIKSKRFINIFPLQLALAAENKKYNFHVSGGASDASSSLLPPKDHLKVHPNVNFNEIIEVDGVNLDCWCKANLVSEVDFMWLDMQGAEFDVLSSSNFILNRTKAIYTEVSLVETYKNVTLYPQYRKFLESNGFQVELEHLNWSDMGNVLFIRH